MKKFRFNAVHIIFGIGLGLIILGFAGLDSVDMTVPAIISGIGLVLVMISAPFLSKEFEREEDSVVDCDDNWNSNYPYDRTFRRR